MTVFASQVATAQRLIAAKGKAVTWVTYATQPVVGEPWDLDDATSPPVETPVTIVFLPNGSGRPTGASRPDAEDVPDGYFYGLMAATAALEPGRFDTVVDGSSVYSVATIDRLAPNGESILYTVSFKGRQA